MITDARTSPSREMGLRERNYVITMAFRMACFASIFFVHGWLRWVVLAGAVFLPIIAVLFANQANTKTPASKVEPGGPVAAPQLSLNTQSGQVIEGELVDDPQQPVGRSERRDAEDDGDYDQRDRVA